MRRWPKQRRYSSIFGPKASARSRAVLRAPQLCRILDSAARRTWLADFMLGAQRVCRLCRQARFPRTGILLKSGRKNDRSALSARCRPCSDSRVAGVQQVVSESIGPKDFSHTSGFCQLGPATGCRTELRLSILKRTFGRRESAPGVRETLTSPTRTRCRIHRPFISLPSKTAKIIKRPKQFSVTLCGSGDVAASQCALMVVER